MTFWEEIIAIIIGVAIVDVTIEVVKHLYDRWNFKELYELECDLCSKPRKLVRTPDIHFWLCVSCMKTYLNNPDMGFTDEQKTKVLNKFKSRRRKKGK